MAKVIPKLRVPLQMAGGRLATVEQDGIENVQACVYTILSYERGSRIEDPNFGVEDPTFVELPLDTQEWIEQVNRYEPRAEVGTLEDVEDEVGAILVEVGLR